MKAEEVDIKKLFGSDQQFIIPLWQRHYSWDRGQWLELWQDVVRAAEPNAPEHFLGSIVLQALPWEGSPNEAKQYYVVDGQQRVTTLTILVCAMRDRIAQLEDDPVLRQKFIDQRTSQLLLNTYLKEAHSQRLLLQETDRALLAPLVDGTWAGGESGLVEKAYSFFRKQLSTFSAEAVENLQKTLMTQLTAVWVTLDSHDNAHRVFQTLNAGGKKLKQSDLVRNYFFLLLGPKGDEFYANHWRSFEVNHGERELDDYLVAWSISQGHTGGKDSIFSYFHKDLKPHESNPEKILEYGIALTDGARLFDWIRDPQGSSLPSKAKTALSDLSKWGTTPIEGLLLWLLQENHQGRLTDPDLAGSLEIALSFLARRQLAGYEPNLHKSIMVATTRKLREASLPSADLPLFFRAVLSSGEEVRTWPTDEQIKTRSGAVPIYSSTRSAWTFVILERLNRSLFTQSKHAVPNLSRDDYTIEHIMPQTITKAWIDDLSSWGVEAPLALHQSKLHVLGNLTLTPINSELGNARFDKKLELLSDDWLKLNIDVCKASTWTEAHINERSLKLANDACAVFTRPLTPNELSDAHLKLGISKSANISDEAVQAVQEELEA